MRLRKAAIRDGEFLWELRCRPSVARMMFGPTPTWEAHQEWLNRVLDDPLCRLWVIWERGKRVGYVRFDAAPDRLLERVSIAVHPYWHGLGIGRAALEAALKRVRNPVVADIKPDNEASRRLFSAAGFCETYRDALLVRMVWRRKP